MTIVTNDNLVFLIVGVNGANIMVGNHSIATLLQKKRCPRHNICVKKKLPKSFWIAQYHSNV